jgi:dihydroxyacid dehydratase/phosphogluconate dehydratase
MSARGSAGRSVRCRLQRSNFEIDRQEICSAGVQNVGMGWRPEALRGDEFLLLSTHGGIRAPDGTPVALGYPHGPLGSWPAARKSCTRIEDAGAIPFAASCTDPCDGRSQGTSAMFDSLPFRNDAAAVFRRLIRSLPTRRGVLGAADVRQRPSLR